MDPNPGADHSHVLENFIAITGSERSHGAQLLEATNYDLGQAVELYFATDGASDAQLARSLANEEATTHQPAASSAINWEEDVRAPDPAKLDRLYGEHEFLQLRDRAAGLRPPTTEINAFRDFEAESSRRQEAANARGVQKQKSRLGEMFQPPTGLKFQGDFEEAKQTAQQKSMWLLVNIQSNTEFASHQLNRDTWADLTLQDILKASFIFLQVHDTAPEGQKIQTYYKLHELPALVVIDPITGSALRIMTGFVPPERLMEDLVPFLDCSPEHPDAHRLGQDSRKRRAPSKPRAPTEDEELEMALALSLTPQEGEPSTEASTEKPAENGTSTAGEVQKEAPPPAAAEVQDAKEVQADAAAALMQTPEPSGSSGCRVAIRFPDGSRNQRLFSKTAPLQILRTFCIAFSAEAAAGKPFALKQTGPGGSLLDDMEKTLEEAGVANSLVSMSWS